jgi:hypothetical protein
MYQRFIAAANRLRLANLERLRELKRHHGRDIRLFCAHDAQEFEQFSQIGGSPGPIVAPHPSEAITESGDGR